VDAYVHTDIKQILATPCRKKYNVQDHFKIQSTYFIQVKGKEEPRRKPDLFQGG